MMKFITVILAMLLSIPHATAAGVDSAAIVAAHNKWRKEVGVGKLLYSAELAVSAQAWADTLKQDHACRMHHSKTNGKYGENIYWASATVWTDGRRALQKLPPTKPVDSWGSEKADYHYATNRCKPGKICGHYTQIVWKDSKKVGCARAVCDDTQDQVWVCHYQPAGNWVGEKPY